MPYIFLGSLAFLFFVAYDINSVTINNRLLKGGFFIGCILLIGATGGIISATIKEAIWYSIRTPIFLTAAIVFLVFLVYTLFFAIPFETTYLKTDQPPKTCTTGLYALSRHPGVLWFAGFYFSLWLALSGSLLLAAGILFTILNFLYVVLQDRWIFMIIFPDYGQYKKTTPFLIPNHQSFIRCINTFCQTSGKRVQW